MLRLLLITLTVLSLASTTDAQKLWSVEDCILYARQNSISIKRAQNNIASAEIGKRQAVHNRFPTLNASVNGGYSFGRSIDPTTNSFVGTSFGSNSYSLNTGMVVFNGNAINNQIKLTQLDLEAAKLEAEFVTDNLSVEIALNFLNILLAEEQLEIVKKRLEQSQEQLRQTDQLIQAGSLPENDRLNVLSTIASDEQVIIDAENQVQTAYISLQQAMLLDPSEDFKITRPLVSIPEDFDPFSTSLNEVYTSAYNFQKNLKANALRLQSANLNVDVTKANFLPSLTIGGGMSSNYSNGFKSTTVVPVLVQQTVFINGEPVTLEIEGQDFIREDIPFFDQINQNLGQNIGFSISIPIYNGLNTRLNTERARLGVINQELINREAEQTLRTNVQAAIAAARNSKRSMDAAQLAVDAAQAAYKNAQRQFELGAINTLDFTTSRLNLDQAQISLLRAKFQYIFNVKQIEFYQGKGITLN